MNSSLPADKPASLHLLQERLQLRLSPTRWPKPECTEGEQCMICHALATLTAWDQAGSPTVSVDASGGMVPDAYLRPQCLQDEKVASVLAFDLGMDGWLVVALHEAGATTAVSPGLDWEFKENTYSFVRWFPGTPYNTAAGSVKVDGSHAMDCPCELPDSVWNPLNGQKSGMQSLTTFGGQLKLCIAYLEQGQSTVPGC